MGTRNGKDSGRDGQGSPPLGLRVSLWHGESDWEGYDLVTDKVK